MGDAVRNYDSYTSQETLSGADPTDAEDSAILAGALRDGSAEPSESATALP